MGYVYLNVSVMGYKGIGRGDHKKYASSIEKKGFSLNPNNLATIFLGIIVLSHIPTNSLIVDFSFMYSMRN